MSPHEAQLLYRVMEGLHDFAQRTDAPEGFDVFHWAEQQYQRWVNNGSELAPLRGEIDPAVLKRCA